VRRVPARVTNLTLLAALLLVFATGVGASASGTERGRWIVIGPRAAGLLVVLMIPAKLVVCARVCACTRTTRWLSLGLAALAVAALLFGIGHSTGLVRSLGGFDALCCTWQPRSAPRTAAAVAPRRAVGPARAGRMRRAGPCCAPGGWRSPPPPIYGAWNCRAARLPRRFTGSYDAVPSIRADAEHIWLNDSTPLIDASTWRLTVVGTDGPREYPLADLRPDRDQRALLDCTSGCTPAGLDGRAGD
jgi:hypothetical protein